jgi:Xaa-Pro dipeptidase
MTTLGDYPRFSDEELTRRRNAILQCMDAAEVSHLLAYGSDKTGSAVQWLSEWPVTTEAALIVSRDHRDVLFVQHYNHLPNARRIALTAEVNWGGRDTLASAIEVLRSRLAAGERVGVLGPLRHHQHVRLTEALGEIPALDGAFQRLRLVKSAEEIDRLRIAARLSDAAVEALAEHAVPGVDERELGAIVEAAYLAEGATNHIHYFATTPMDSPAQCVPAQYPSDRRLEAGDVLFCEISAAYWGYAGQVLRTFTVAAEPTPLVADLHATADAAFDAIVAAIKPGTPARDLVEASSVIEERGYTIFDDLVHGYGGGYLPPVLGTASRPNLEIPDLTLEAGMALVVQPNVITTDERIGVQTGHLLVVTDDGQESLHSAPRGLRRIG